MRFAMTAKTALKQKHGIGIRWYRMSKGLLTFYSELMYTFYFYIFMWGILTFRLKPIKQTQ